MLEKRKSRKTNPSIDGWDAPPLLKAQMAFEIIWFCVILYLIWALFRVIGNVGSRQRQPYILLLVSAILLDIAHIVDAVGIRLNIALIADAIVTDSYLTIPASTYIALFCASYPLWYQPTVLITMAGLWVFRERSQLISYGKGARGIPYAGKTWKFIADWTVASCSLLFLALSVTVYVIGYSLYFGVGSISTFDYNRFFDAQRGLSYVQFAFYFILTIVFVVTGVTLNSAFKRQTGRPDVVRHFPTRLGTSV